MLSIEEYFHKSGDDYLLPGEVIKDDKGFLIYKVFDDDLYILHVYGDGEHFEEIVEELAKKHQCKNIKATTRRPKAFGRKYNMEVDAYVMKRIAKWVQQRYR